MEEESDGLSEPCLVGALSAAMMDDFQGLSGGLNRRQTATIRDTLRPRAIKLSSNSRQAVEKDSSQKVRSGRLNPKSQAVSFGVAPVDDGLQTLVG